VVARAGVSESIFNDVFATPEDCYLAAFEEGLARLSRAVELAVPSGASWLERVRAGLVGLLGFLDDEPQWGRLLLLEAAVTGPVTLRSRQCLLGVVTRLLENPDPDMRAQPLLTSALTAELVAGGVFCLIRARILEGHYEALVDLAPSLMSFIALQYGGPVVGGQSAQTDDWARAQSISRTAELPVRATHRTTLVLRAIEHAPYSNNREIAQAAGLADEGQTSKLLARLERQGVIENVGIGAARGEPNAWLLTASGRRALTVLDASGSPPPRAARIRGEA
jgi:AcrR family transcriptional regulator